MRIFLSKYRDAILLRNTLLLLVFCAALVPSAYASSEIFLQCAQQYPGDDVERLKCYDQLTNRAPLENADPVDEVEASSIPAAPDAATARSAGRSYLTRAWNLDNLSHRDASKLGRMQPYRQSYLVFKTTSNNNLQPSSPLADHNVQTPNDIDSLETKFQLSFKADIGQQRNINFLGIKTIRFWGAYTQQSHLQVFNSRNSSPFRETVYEPELIATLGTGNASGLKLINLGWLHQSNGRPLPESRSWNRLFVLGGWEWNDMTSILLRGWQRVPESGYKDDNPDISDYLGRADLQIRWEPRDKSQAVAILVRNNLSKIENRGFVQIDWATPVQLGSSARMHLQLSSGYGESLIDYNHHQHTLGLGFSFREW